MKIQRQKLQQIIREELRRHVRNLDEATIQDAQEDNKQKEDDGEREPQKDQDSPDNGASPKSPKSKELPPDDGETEEPNEQPDGDDPADDDLEDETDAEDTEEKEDDAKTKLGDQLAGKSIQSMTQEPKSKVLPGAQEIVLTFANSTEPLRILVTKTGQVKFYYSGALHNEV